MAATVLASAFSARVSLSSASVDSDPHSTDSGQPTLRATDARILFQEHWRHEMRNRTPDEKIAWLRLPEVISALGAKVCRDLVRQVKGPRDRVERAVWPCWFDHWQSCEELPPGLGVVGKAVVQTSCELHRHGVRLRLSRETTRTGQCGTATRRFTPPQAVETEDFLDGMTSLEALRYEHPESPSASVIRRVGEMKGQEQ
jgi:hypothetical protein